LAQHLYKLASELEQVGIDVEHKEDGVEVLRDNSHYPLPQTRTFATYPQKAQPTARLALAQAGMFLEQYEEDTGREPILIALNITVDSEGNFFTTLTIETDEE
jgi:hypothetical protein